MRNEDRTIVISSHQLADLERFADHVAVMQAGQVIAFGSIPELLERYAQLDVQLPPLCQRPELRHPGHQPPAGSRLRAARSPVAAAAVARTAGRRGDRRIPRGRSRSCSSRSMKTGRTRGQPKQLCGMNRTILALLLDYHRPHARRVGPAGVAFS